MNGYEYISPSSGESKTYSNTLEAIITCVNYSDFLDQTLPFTLVHVDRLVVVTSFDDKNTQKVCNKWSVECVPTDTFVEKGDAFNKGNAINIGLAMLRQNGWILHLDADIVLPITFRNMLAKSGLDSNCIYGCNRLNIYSWNDWKKLKSTWYDKPQFTQNCLVNSSSDSVLGATLIHKQYGYCPIGYFQLWHADYMNKYKIRYPDVQKSAERSDVQWALRWPRKQRILLPTVRVYHLESERPAKMGTNWNGRKSKTFNAKDDIEYC